MMMTFRGKRRLRGNVKNNMSGREGNYQQDDESKREDNIIPSLLEKLESLEDELKLKDSIVQSLAEKVKCLESSKCVLEGENCHAKEIELKNNELETSRKKIKYLENEIMLSNDKLKSTNEKIEHLENDLELKNSRLNSTIEEINVLKKQLKLKTSELNSAIDENKCLEIELEVKNSTIVSAEERISCLEEENKEKNADFETMIKEIFALNKQLQLKDEELKLVEEDIKFVKSCYNKSLAEGDEAIESDECSPIFIPKKNNQFICISCNKSLCFSSAETQTCITEFNNHPEIKAEISEGFKFPEVAKETVPHMRRKTDEAFATNPDYIYIEAMKLYYSSSSGYYYDPETGISTDSVTGTKYVYCPTTQTYRLFIPTSISQQLLVKRLEEQSEYKKRKISMPINPSKALKSEKSDADMEEFSSRNDSNEDGNIVNNGNVKSYHNVATIYAEKPLLSNVVPNVKLLPPSIRCIVLESETLQEGSLLLVTCTGVTIGQDINCTMCIPDSDVSINHAKIDFNASTNCYVITDLGSESGTFLNDLRLSQPKEQSEPHHLNHRDILRIANCKLLMHIHHGKETCSSCEPGQVRADLISSANKKPELIMLTKEEKEKERIKELNKLKKRFGLKNAGYEVEKLADIENLGYKDLAKERQIIKGSDNPYEKTEVQCLDQSLTVKNKGFRLLQKMGWSEGEGLGKTSSGRVEPVPIPASVPQTSIKKKPRIMSKAAMRNFQREISLLSGNTKVPTQSPSANQQKTSQNTLAPVNFVGAAAPMQIAEKEVSFKPDPTLSPNDLFAKMIEKQSEDVRESEDTMPPIGFLSKLVEKEPEVIDVPAPTMPPVNFLSKLVEKQPDVNDTPSILPSTDFLSKLVEKQPEVNDVPAPTLTDVNKTMEQQPETDEAPPTDFLSKLMKRKPKQKRRCREMIDGYTDPANHS